MNFQHLIHSIQQTHTAFHQYAVKAINKSLTVRNWLIGFYIVEFEQKGENRSKYGDKLLVELAKLLKIKGLGKSNLKTCRQFYLVYPQFGEVLADEFKNVDLLAGSIGQTLSGQFQKADNQPLEKGQTLSGLFQEDENQESRIDRPTPKWAVDNPQIPPGKLIDRLSFSHLAELLEVNDPLKRCWYEIECIKGNWSVRELRRQINSLYYERSRLSTKPEALSETVTEKATKLQPVDIIKSVYTFEFPGLHAKDVVEENDLEVALLDNLQEFMLELGHGFCFEARQKRILVGNEYSFIDLVFYHRILKCHILIDLKIEEFNHHNAGQLNTYLNYYKAEVQQPGDNPPVGILLVTNKNQTLVEYATAGMDHRLFVSKYLVELPDKQQLVNLVQNELRHL